MKARFARPTPQQVEPYFFEHLVHRAGNDAADASAAASPPTTEAAEQPTSWVLAPVTASKDINELLWAKFAPDDHKISIQNFVETEHRRTSALTEDLRDTWNKVEEVVSLNQHRHEFLCSEEVLEKLTSAIKDMVFWTAEDLTTHFHLEVAIGTEDTPEVDPNNEFSKTVSAARITLDFSVPTDRTNLPEDGETEGAAAVSIVDEEAGADAAKVLQKKAKAWSMTREDLLNPCKRPHCLRRLFAPLLQRRQELPKNTNLLLNELQEVQSKMLPRLEKSIERGIMFNIPLYIPFQITAQFISRYFSKESRTPSIEVAQVNRFRPMMASMKDLKRHVGEATVDATLLDAMSPEGRQDLSETMWRLLFEELQMHKAAHAEGMSKYRELSSASTEFLSDLNRAFGECTAASQQSMDLLVQDADSCAEALANTGTRTVVIVKEMGEAYERNSSLLKASIQKKEYAINKSEAQQEKLARRVREAVKDLHAEQLKYEELTQELLQERLTLSQLESSYEQVKKAIEIRHEGALDAQKRAEEVRCLLRAAEKARWSLVESCTKHIGRLTTDDYYRRCRIAGQCVSNAEQWSRCLHDMAFLYEERYNTVDRMAQASWQMSYLAAGERDWAVSNLAEVREELAGLESHFGDIASILSDLELDVPALRDAATDEDKELRRKMRQLDEVRQVQRNVTTIKEFRRRLENPASGRGLGAARGLATGGGSTGASAPAYPAASETGGDDCRPGVKLPAISGKRGSSESPRTEADESSKPSAERRPRTEKEDCLKKLEEVD